MLTQKYRQFLRLKQVSERVGYQRSAIYAKVQSGEFPKPYQLGPRAVGWLAEEVDSWIESRIKGAR